MAAEHLDPAYAAELLERQHALQVEADQVIAELELVSRLTEVGQVCQIGSSVSGLMVWRDLDFSIICPGRRPANIFAVVCQLASDPQVLELHYRNEAGPRSPSELPEDERYYFVLRYATAAGHVWKIDLSFWVTDAIRHELWHAEQLRQRLTDESRLIILWLKDLWHRQPSYPYQVGGTDIYDAVLNHGLRTPEQFETYLRQKGLPNR